MREWRDGLNAPAGPRWKSNRQSGVAASKRPDSVKKTVRMTGVSEESILNEWREWHQQTSFSGCGGIGMAGALGGGWAVNWHWRVASLEWRAAWRPGFSQSSGVSQ